MSTLRLAAVSAIAIAAIAGASVAVYTGALSLSALRGSAIAQTPGAPIQTGDFTLQRVMLSTGGVGYFEYTADAEGEAKLALPVRLDQMDDVLKSIVVFDEKGVPGTVEAPGRTPLADIFRGLSFDGSALSSGADLIGALQGAEVSVTGPVSATGRIVGIAEESVTDSDGDTLSTRHRVSLMTGSGLVQFVLEDATGVTFTDAALKAEIDRALAAVARHREQNTRTLTITAKGEGRRRVTVGFVVAAPLWKSTYRLTPGADGKARLTGLAVVDNASGFDWQNVELTIASGNPVTFRQALYQTYYVDRPEVPVEVAGRILPKADTGAIAVTGMARKAEAGPQMMPMAPPPPPAPVMAAPEPGSASDYMVTSAVITPPTEAADTGTQVVFKLPSRVSVGSGQSLTVPLVDAEVPAERVAVYQPDTHARHPLMAVRVTNATGFALPPGAITLYDAADDGRAFVGDAQLSSLPAGETRFLAFALDTKVLIDRETQSDQQIGRATLANGVLTTARVNRETTIYRVKAPAGEERRIVFEHPRWEGYTLVAPTGDGIELGDVAHRIPFTVAAGQEATLTVIAERPIEEQVALIDLHAELLLAYATAPTLSEQARTAFRDIAERKRVIDGERATAERLIAERERLFGEQERLRENIKAVPEGDQLQRRYLDQLGRLEDRAQQLADEITAAERRRDEAQAALAQFVGGLTIN